MDEDAQPVERAAWWHHPPIALGEMLALLQKRAGHLKDTTEEGHALRTLFEEVNSKFKDTVEDARKAQPLGFFKPSYEQCLMLNAWWTGTNFLICFSANRIGKTTCMVLNSCLWIYPNDPAWVAYQPYTDEFGRHVTGLLERPKLAALVPLQKFLKENPNLAGNPKFPYDHKESGNAEKFQALKEACPGYFRPAFPAAPVQKNSTIWLGAPDASWHKSIMLKRWRDWLPPSSITRWSEADLTFTLSTESSTNPRPTEIQVQCKSYESDDTKWSGDAVTGIMLSEGFPEKVLDEIKQRFTQHAFASWDYTPTDSINLGNRVRLAHDVFKGRIPLPLRHHVWTGFSVRNAPAHIIPVSKRDDLIRIWENKKAGKARLDGEFFSSSNQLLPSLSRDFHCVNTTFKELREKFPTAPLYRGFDPGYDHPSACAWGLLTPNNIWYVYRFWTQRNITIPQRARTIVELSNNALRKVYFGKQDSEDFYWEEYHPTPDSEPILLTAADYHLFKRDEISGNTYALTYNREGLVLTESTHLSPAGRVLELDKLFDTQNYPYHVHPVLKTTPGARVYFLMKEPGVAEAVDALEALYWQQLQGGPNKGEAKDAPPLHGDDELDALCYMTTANYRYIPGNQGVWKPPHDEADRELEKADPILASVTKHIQDRHRVTAMQAYLLRGLDPNAQPSTKAGHFN